MTIIRNFFVGVFFAAVLIGGAVFYKINSESRHGTGSPGAQTITIKGVIMVPPALVPLTKKGVTVVALMHADNKPGVLGVFAFNDVKFPFKLEVPIVVPADGAGDQWVMRFRHCGEEKEAANCLFGTTLPQIFGQSAAFRLESKNGQLDLGNLDLNRQFTHSQTAHCLTQDFTLAGTVSPLPELAKKFPSAQIALIVVPGFETAGETIFYPVSYKNLFYATALDFSKGAAPFKAVVPGTRPGLEPFKFLQAYAVACTEKDANACAARILPELDDSKRSENFVPLADNGFGVSFCGDRVTLQSRP